MFKKLIIVFLFLSGFIYSQDKSHLGVDEKTGKPILIGKINREAFVDSNSAWWFNSAYKFYKPDTSIINELKQVNLNSVKVKIVLGTWCSDSRREVPRFFKIVDLLNYPSDHIELFGVNRDKVLTDSETEIDDIKFVPTFIFYRDNEEAGRIVETPDETLEEDMLDILE